MIKDFIPYEQALAVKELGFDENCFCYYELQGKELVFREIKNTIISNWRDSFMKFSQCSAPTYQQAFRWFREKYNLYHFISSESDSARMSASIRKKIVTDDSKFEFWSIIEYVRAKKASPYNTFENHEESELECLKKMIEYCKRDFNRDVV